MNFLVISPTPSHPQNAGNRQRIYTLLRYLKACGHQVHFCFIRREWVTDEDIRAMEAAWDKVTLLAHDRKKEKKPSGGIHAIDDWFLPSLESEMKRIAEEETPDVVMVEYVFFSKALQFFGENVLKIIDSHDVFTDRHIHLQKIGLEPSFFYTNAAQEKIGLNRADIVLAIQDEERAKLQEITEAAVVTVGFMPDVQSLPADKGNEGATIGYIGSSNPLNVRAVKRFLEAVDPTAVADGKARIRIGGGTATALKDEEVKAELVTPVDALAPFYATLNLAVNPHEGGTGLKIKTVEALAHGRPVIGTWEAFLGLAPEAAFHSANSAAEVGTFVNRFIENVSFREEVRQASLRLAERYARTVESQLRMFRSMDELRSHLTRPRILYITDIPFWQESLGNHARMAEQIRAARGCMDIDVFIFRTLSKNDLAAAQAIVGARGKVFSFKSYPGCESRQPAWIEASAALSGFEKKSLSRQYFRALEEHLQVHQYAGYIIQYIRLSYLRHAQGLPKLSIIDIHDIMSIRSKNFSHFGLEHFLQISEKEELEILSNFRAILAIQTAEHRYLESLFPGKSIYLPHALSEVRRTRSENPVLRIVFVGGDSPMNRDGLNWFLSQVWPCFYHAGVELHVAGEVCKSLAVDHPQVVLHGRIDDLRGFLEQADIAINPVYYGGGLKIKTVEYLCYGIPSVLTVEATFGIPGGENEAYLLATSRAEFIEHLSLLIRSPEARGALSEAAFAFGRRMFGVRSMTPGLDAVAALASRQPRLPVEA